MLILIAAVLQRARERAREPRSVTLKVFKNSRSAHLFVPLCALTDTSVLSSSTT